MKSAWTGFGDELQPIVGTELTDYGWRGITADGEIINMRSTTGIPESISMFQAGSYVGQRSVSADVISVTDYLNSFNQAIEFHRQGCDAEALVAVDEAIGVVNTLRARHNRAMILLSLGKWEEGFAEFELCEREPPFIRPNTQLAIGAGRRPWRGEPLEGMRLLVMHDHGFGDTLMMLRFIRPLRWLGAQVTLSVPPELESVARQFAQVVDASEPYHFFTTFLHLMRWMKIDRDDIPAGPYIQRNPILEKQWEQRLGPAKRERIGVAWSTRVEHPGDFPRSLPLEEIVKRFPEAEFHSVQKQGQEEAQSLGVITHDLPDFLSTAALMTNMDRIVSVDTAAVHLAGAIGHPKITLLLSKWHSWRWFGNRFYPWIQIMESGR